MLTPAILTNEYPPTGMGIGGHVHRLASELSQLGAELAVHVIANSDRYSSGFAKEAGVNVHRVTSWIDGNNFLNWTLALNSEYVREMTALNASTPITILHAHDWMTVPAAVILKNVHQIPYVVTIHSTEKKRCNGIHSEYSQAIDSIEEQGIRQASMIIVNDEETQSELLQDFGATNEKVELIRPSERDWAPRIVSVYKRASSGVGLH